MAAGLAAALSGCLTGRPMIKQQLIMPELPPAAKLPCARPQRLPADGVNERQAVQYWLRDRQALRACEARRQAAAAAFETGLRAK